MLRILTVFLVIKLNMCNFTKNDCVDKNTIVKNFINDEKIAIDSIISNNGITYSILDKNNGYVLNFSTTLDVRKYDKHSTILFDFSKDNKVVFTGDININDDYKCELKIENRLLILNYIQDKYVKEKMVLPINIDLY